jgi:glycosyltransferase involved in cell wall biosynthesis
MNILYLGREKSIHDLRFLNALVDIASVTMIFANEEKNFLYPESEAYDVIIQSPLTENFFTLSTWRSIPRIGIAFGYDINEEAKNEEVNAVLRKNLADLTGIIVDCHYLEKILRQNYAFSGDIWVIPYGCDFTLFERTGGKHSQKLKILVNRKWTLIHGNETVLESLNLLSQEIDFSAKFIGDGPLLNQLRYRYHNLESSGIIEYLPPCSPNELAMEFADTWCYVSGSQSDGTSISLLEAMSAGLLCVTSDFPSNNEWINNGISGFTFKNGSATGLAQTLLKISKISTNDFIRIQKAATIKVQLDGDWNKNKIRFQNVIIESKARWLWN